MKKNVHPGRHAREQELGFLLFTHKKSRRVVFWIIFQAEKL